jgi:hypothetical protein
MLAACRRKDKPIKMKGGDEECRTVTGRRYGLFANRSDSAFLIFIIQGKS